MFAKIDPLFTDGRILKKEGLESLRDYPREYLDILYDKYEDGIIEGLIPVEKNGMIQISPGIVKINKSITIVKKQINLIKENDSILVVNLTRLNEGEEKLNGMKIIKVLDVNTKHRNIEVCRIIENKINLENRVQSPNQSFGNLVKISADVFIQKLIKLDLKAEDICILRAYQENQCIDSNILNSYINTVLKDQQRQERTLSEIKLCLEEILEIRREK